MVLGWMVRREGVRGVWGENSNHNITLCAVKSTYETIYIQIDEQTDGQRMKSVEVVSFLKIKGSHFTPSAPRRGHKDLRNSI